jgi:hypothetical protein
MAFHNDSNLLIIEENLFHEAAILLNLALSTPYTIEEARISEFHEPHAKIAAIVLS